MSGLDASVTFAPFFPWWALMSLGVAGMVAIAAAALARAGGAGWRLVAMAALWLALANPSLVVEERESLPDIAIAVLDESPSQNVGQRRARSEAALKGVRDSMARIPGLELRVVRAGGAPGEEGTRLFTALWRALSEVPARRLAGVLMITDGQVHDAPKLRPDGSGGTELPAAPIHVLLSGKKGESDRRLVVESAPSYGLIGKSLAMNLRVDEPTRAGRRDLARITIQRDGRPWRTIVVPVGISQRVEFVLDRAGPAFFELVVDPGTHELTLENNRAVVAVNGVRDRLRVLLISGEPHPGERSWRNLLKSDPAVDLVHFTILRPPDKQDFTPVGELALISFPVRELFEVKLEEFDLIIFDRYRRRGVILSNYIENIAKYVEGGGALLVAVGPNFAGELSLYHTPLGAILPASPTGKIVTGAYRATVSANGKRHPVTADLTGARRAKRRWGRWFRQVVVTRRRGQMLMTGAGGRPLLIADRVGSGRVALLLSDHIWLWGRGYDGGGPQAELVRRLAHWLMKERDLEENDLRAEARGDSIEIVRRSLTRDDSPVTVTTPSGKTQRVKLREIGGGRAVARVPVGETGLYRVKGQARSALAAVGALNPLEVADVRATARRLAPVAAATGGRVIWLAERPAPGIRRVRPGRRMAGGASGATWLGLRGNNDYLVAGIRVAALLPGLLVLLLGLGALLLAWRREAR